MVGAHGLTRSVIKITNELKQLLHYIVKVGIVYDNRLNFAYRYAHRVIGWLNEEERKTKSQEQTPNNGMIKCSGINHKR